MLYFYKNIIPLDDFVLQFRIVFYSVGIDCISPSLLNDTSKAADFGRQYFVWLKRKKLALGGYQVALFSCQECGQLVKSLKRRLIYSDTPSPTSDRTVYILVKNIKPTVFHLIKCCQYRRIAESSSLQDRSSFQIFYVYFFELVYWLQC